MTNATAGAAGATSPSLLNVTKVHSLSYLVEVYRGIGPGFDALRLGLALLIFYTHTRYALRPMDGNLLDAAAVAPAAAVLEASRSWFEEGIANFRSRLYVIFVPMFFALSGFLVTASALRLQNVKRFLIFRGLRIFPALTVEVIISALLLGVIFSTLPASEYFTDPGFYRYLGNIVGIISFHLPGVFVDNPQSGMVNINLWTLPAEFYCYLILSTIMGLGLLKADRNLFLILLAMTIAGIILTVIFGIGVTPSVYSTGVVVLHFLIGMGFYLWRQYIPMNPLLFLISVIVTLATMSIPSMSVVAAVFVTYVTVYIGFFSFLKMDLMKGRDYSYGIYLYGFPITQAVIAAYPQVSSLTLLAVALPLTIVIAALSWHYIEKPMLRFKK
jgi:peptidoglycan/LPS O-acetylase OafA/YrhL